MNKKQFAQKVLEIMGVPAASSGPPHQGPPYHDDSVESWTRAAVRLLEHIKNAGLSEVLEDFKVPGDVQFYIEVIAEAAKNHSGNTLVRYLKPSVQPQDVVSALVTICQQGHFSKKHFEALRIMLRTGVDWPWGQLVQTIGGRLRNGGSLAPQELEALVDSLLTLSSEEADQLMDALAREGWLFHHLGYSWSNPAYRSTRSPLLMAVLKVM